MGYSAGDLTQLKNFLISHVGTEHNPADLFTKILSRQPFEKHRKTVLNLPGDTGVEHGVRTRMAKARPPGLPAG